MGFGELTRLRNEMAERKKREIIELSLEDCLKIFRFKQSVFILRKLSESDKTPSEINAYISNKKQNHFLNLLKRLGLVEKYYDKKQKKYYFRLIPREVRVYLE